VERALREEVKSARRTSGNGTAASSSSDGGRESTASEAIADIATPLFPLAVLVVRRNAPP